MTGAPPGNSTEDALRIGREALSNRRFFDGVQVINAAVEAYEQKLKDGDAKLPPFEALEILRTPEAFFQKVLPSLTDGQKADLASLFALRVELISGLGAHKRALTDLAVAKLLSPDNEEFDALRSVVQGRLDAPAEVTGNDAKTPATIITGFLGAGKTTLLNHILEANHGKRIAIIENEFGEVGIDDALLNTKNQITEENIIEMSNGCICCTVRGDLITGLKKIHKQTKGKGKPLDGVIIETTGLADPAPVAQTFYADDFVQTHLALDGILTVVDAKHILGNLREEKPEGAVNEAVEQVAFADRILLNKTDLVTAEYLEEVEEELRTVNANAAIRRTENSQVDMDFVLGIQAFSLDKVIEDVSTDFLEEDGHQHEAGDDAGHGHGDHGHGGHGGHGGHSEGHDHDGDGGHGGHGEGHGHDREEHGHDGHGCHGEGHGHDECHAGHGESHGHDEGHAGHGHNEDHSHAPRKKKRHVHDYRVTSVGICEELELAQDKLDRFLGWLIQSKGKDLYRSKGVLAVKDMPNKFVFHAVQMQFSGKPQSEKWQEGETRRCKMVFIGKNLDREELISKFMECAWKPREGS